MIDNLYLYKSVQVHKEKYPPIVVRFCLDQGNYFIYSRVKDTSVGQGNKKGLRNLLAYSHLTKWSDEE